MGRPWSHRQFDVGLAGVMAAIAVAEALTGPDRYPQVFVVASSILLAAPLLLRRGRPLVALGLVLGVVVVQRLVLGEIWDSGSSLAIPMIAIYSAAAFSSLRPATAALLTSVTVVSICDMGDGGDSADVAFIALIFGALWIAGRMTHRQRELAAANAAYARELEELQQVRQETAAREERARIARELHDIVAHCVSTIVVQAEAGQALMDSDKDRARDAFGAIQETGREALTELRRMLGLLREGPTDPEQPVPQPTLARLEPLLDRFRGAGLSVDLEVAGVPRPLPAGVDSSAYRIIQESLTNTLKHAHASRATVRLNFSAEHLNIEVVDDGAGPLGRGHEAEHSSGHGLVGMAERAHLMGGSLESGGAGGRGYVVRTKLPLP